MRKLTKAEAMKSPKRTDIGAFRAIGGLSVVTDNALAGAVARN